MVDQAATFAAENLARVVDENLARVGVVGHRRLSGMLPPHSCVKNNTKACIL
jgi:hypothetical protein